MVLTLLLEQKTNESFKLVYSINPFIAQIELKKYFKNNETRKDIKKILCRLSRQKKALWKLSQTADMVAIVSSMNCPQKIQTNWSLNQHQSDTVRQIFAPPKTKKKKLERESETPPHNSIVLKFFYPFVIPTRQWKT